MVAKNAVIAALASTGLISLAPNVILFLFPQYASGEGKHSAALSLGQAMAAGGLLGDVFLHTISHSSGSEGVGLCILLGFTIFLVADMAMRSLGSGHSHGEEKKGETQENHHNDAMMSAVLLNLAADSMHNFTDGLAIGVSFSISSDPDASVLSLLKSRGGLATLSIMIHEIPHELGDFAVLVKNGFSNQQAIMAQFGTALAAMAGTVSGIYLEDIAGEALIFVTAGGFIYLAACTIIPELLEERASFKFRLMQLICFGAGIAFLYAVSILEAMDGGHHGHSHGHAHHTQHTPETKDHAHDHHDHAEEYHHGDHRHGHDRHQEL